jgi:DUF971 family protein/molybdopterin converting factor small subunit
MNENTPTEIKYHKKSKLLEIQFANGEQFKLSCEYLRTHAKTAEIRASILPVAGKAKVGIDKIEPQGSYALRLFFDDGYESAIFSWQTLLDLGQNYTQNWQNYLQKIEKYQLSRGEKSLQEQIRIVKLIYFMDKILAFSKTQEETLTLPNEVNTVSELLAFLRKRGRLWTKEFTEETMQVTVNKEFIELFTVLDHNDEVAFVPRYK